MWVGCIAGALRDEDYVNKLTAAGFEAVSIEPTRVYQIEDARTFLTGQGMNVDAIARYGRWQIHECIYPRQQTRLCGGNKIGPDAECPEVLLI